MAMIYYRGGYKAKCHKGACGKAQGKPGTSFQASSLSGVTRKIYLIPPVTNCENVCEMLSAREAH